MLWEASVTAPFPKGNGFYGFAPMLVRPQANKDELCSRTAAVETFRAPRLLPSRRLHPEGTRVHHGLLRPLGASCSFKTYQFAGLNAMSMTVSVAARLFFGTSIPQRRVQ